MARKQKVDWTLEIQALLDMAVTACGGHRITAMALRDAMAAASDDRRGAGIQKLLLARMCAEEVAAHEDLGALVPAVANRRGTGILRNYLTYKPKEISRLYQRIAAGQPVVRILNLPEPRTLTAVLNSAERKQIDKSLGEIQRSLWAAASNYTALGGALVIA